MGEVPRAKEGGEPSKSSGIGDWLARIGVVTPGSNRPSAERKVEKKNHREIKKKGRHP